MDENQLSLDLEVDQQASRSLIDTARWARFIAIFIFAVMALFLVLVLFLRTAISSGLENVFPGMFEAYGVLIAVVICIVLIFSAILFFLLRGANLIKKGVEIKDQQMLTDGLRSLKIYFIIYGVLSIIGLVFNLMALI